MSVVPRLLPKLLALVAGVAAALVLGCGDNSKLIPSGDASRLKDRIAEVRSAIEAGDCARAQAAANRAKASAALLDPQIDRRLRERINDGLNALIRGVPDACRQAQTQTETIQTVTQPQTTSTPTTSTPTTSTPTTTTTTTTTTTPTTTTGTPTTTTPPDSGGTPSGEPQP